MLSDRHMRVLAAIALALHLSVDELAAVVGEERRSPPAQTILAVRRLRALGRCAALLGVLWIV